MIANSQVEVYAEGERLPLYSGIVQSAEAKEENGLRMICLQLVSGSILLDMEKKSRSYQNTGMSYGGVINEALAPWNTAAIYPSSLSGTAIGFPVIQYQETDWQFVKRMASRFALSLYPEPSIGGSKMYVGIPETGNTCELEAGEYAVRIDEKFYTLGGEKAGYDRSQFLCYEVKSLENHRVGDKARFLGEERYICAKKGSVIHGQMEFTYTLASSEWAGERRLGNKNFSGLSLLGTVSACSNETVQLKLDIDQGKPEQKLYPFNWVPATGNMMYMMPQQGTRVSLYFKGDEETSAVAVNCIRSGGGCAKSDYRDKGLTTEHGMQLKLYRDSMGVETPANKLLMDASKGIEISGSRQLHISAAGDVHIEGKEVCISGFEKVRTYTGILKLTEEEELELEVKAKIELSEGDEGQEADIRGERVTYYLAWEHADLSSPMFRYRDEPEDKSFDWWGLAGNVAGGIAVTAGAAMLGAVGAGLAAGTAIGSAIFGGATAAQAAQVVGTAAFLTGSMYVGSQALSDVLSGRLSSSDTYIRRALAGSIVGIFSGASTLVLADAGLLATMGGGFAEGFAGEAITQKLLNENGEIDWAQCIRSGLFTAVMDGGLYVVIAGRNIEGICVKKRDCTEDVGRTLQNKGVDVRKSLDDYINAYKQSDEYLNLSNAQRKAIDRKLQGLLKGNVAVADVDIYGIKSEFKAHSKIHSKDSIGSISGDFSYAPSAEQRFFESYVEDVFPRYNDTEAKILEDIVSKIKDSNTKGVINLYTELDCCQSCSNLILEFRRKFPNIKLNVFTNNTISH